MDLTHKMLLQQHQKDIVKDLDIQYIIDHLFANNAISKEDFDRICDLTSRAERSRYFIDSLIQNGSNHSYSVFVESLGKDYRWLSDKLTPETMSPSKINDSFEDSLSRGDVPRLPINYVQRVQLEQDICAKLKALTRHKTLALHGMSGSGKTSLAVGVLRNNADLITGTFNGAVFWLNFGNVKTEDDIVIQQNKLHRKASTMFTHRDGSIFMNSSISMSSIGSNADSQSLSNNDWSWQELRDVLKTLFGEPALKEALLVLDEVNEKKFVEAFDIGCRMLVTARDSEVVASFQAQIVEIENRFEESESLQLIASSIDVDVSELPRQARKFNEKISSGSPFLTGLIAAQLAANKERLLHDPTHWNVYRKKLENKDNFFYFTQENPMKKTLAVCINSLKSDILPLYKMLAILPDNVKVTAEVLSKLWNKQIRDVERILKELKSKSLIIESYNQDQRNYNYEVHDLIMTHLRKNSSEDDIKKLHATFLKSYNYDTITNSPVELVDDGYIAFYIGHHIHRTGNLDNKWGLFKLYLNLKFLGNKVRLTGPADAIIDLHKYENKIANGELDRELLHSIRCFLSTHGIDLYRYPRTDLVQSVLQYESKGILYSRAYEMAQENCLNNELYFEMSHEQGLEEIKPSTIDVKEKISSVCFLGDYVLVGTAKGVIKVFHVSTNKLKKELASAGSPVTWLGTCPSNGLIVAALTSQGVVRIWYMDDIDHDLSENSIEEEPEDPVYDENPGTPVTIQPKLGAYLNCRWANNTETLVTHTSKMIILYDVDGKVVQLIDNIDREKIVLCCVPSNDDRHVIAATCVNAIYFVEVIDVATKERVVAFEESVPVTSLLVVPSSNRILVLTPNEVLEHEYNIRPYPTSNRNTYSWKPIISAKVVRENLSFITAILNKSGTLLFISTDDSRVICVCLKTNSYVFDLGNRRGNVISLAVSEVWYDEFMPGSDVLLTGTDATENSAKVWYMDASYVSHTTQKHRKDRLTPLFDASFTLPATPPAPPAPAPPRRHQSCAAPPDAAKRPAIKTKSLDRHSLKPLNLKGICNVNDDGAQPLLAVVDDKSNIQIIRGKKVLTEIPSRSEDNITTVRLSPCNQYVIYGSSSGAVSKYTLRSKETEVIMDIYSPVQYMKYLNPNLLVVAGKNRCLMAYTFNGRKGEWRSEMLLKGNMSLGSQELLNGIQGNKKKNGNSDSLSRTDSEGSVTSKERQFPSSDHKHLCKNSGIVDCYWVAGVGMLTIENNATIKLWGQDSQDTKMTLICVLNGRQTDVNVVCAAFQKNVVAICDEYGKFQNSVSYRMLDFQTFSLREDQEISLRTINDSKVPFKIMSCDLTSDGHILAMGLDSGDVVIWNVPGKCQLNFVRHHKSKVQACLFSPVPDKLYRSNSAQSPAAAAGQVLNCSADEEQPPLVLVTMASEIVWWDVTRLMRARAHNKTPWRTRVNVLTPQPSPLEARDVAGLAAGLGGMSLDNANGNLFFSGTCTAHDCWERAWRRKTYKEGSKSKEILACIKLSGMNAKKLVADDKFSCFVTVDNPGHVHIMNLMRPTTQS